MSREIRLLSIVTRMNVGGPAMQISTLMRSFAGTRVYQILLTGNVGPDEQDYLDGEGSDLRFVRIKGLQREVRPSKDAQALVRIAHFMRGFKPDIVHTHTAKAGTLGRGAAILTRSSAKRVHTFHGHLLHGYFSEAQTRKVIRVEQALARRSDRLIAVGDQVKNDLLAVGIGREDQYRVVPPGIALKPLPTQPQARFELGLPPDAQIVSFIGRLTPIKRIDRLIEVMQQTAATNPRIHFVIAGEGSEYPELTQAIHEFQLPATALGWRDDVEHILAASDAMVLTSDNEGTPVSLIQAGLAGVPVVATDVGSVKDVVRDGDSGILTDTESSAITAALTTLLSDEQLRASMRRFALHDYQERFGSDILVRNHLSIYDELLGRD